MPERAAFAAFPRLKFAAANELGRLLMLSGLVVKRAKFEAEIAALLNKVRAF